MRVLLGQSGDTRAGWPKNQQAGQNLALPKFSSNDSFTSTSSSKPQQPANNVLSFPKILFGAAKKAAATKEETVDLVLKGVNAGWAKRLVATAESYGINVGEYLQDLLPQFADTLPDKDIMPSVSATVTGKHNGRNVRTKVTTLIGPDQIFQSWIDTLHKTKEYAQIALFDFDNVKVGGRGVDGADVTDAWKMQQKVLEMIEEKARKGVKFQILLDSHVETKYDKRGRPIYPREINNEGMYNYLKGLQEEGLPIEIVSYPRELANIYHVKLLISDGKRAIVGGMNLSNHSAANWDACVQLEGREVANLQAETFHQDWLMARHKREPGKSLEELRDSLPEVTPVDEPAIKVLNTMPREYEQVGYEPREEIGDYFREKLQSPTLAGVYSEQFIATHKVVRDLLIQRNQEGIPVQMLHSAGVIDKFPYCRNTVYRMEMGGVPVRYYPENEATAEQLHAKWTMLEDKNPAKSEVVIGSANTSAAAFETNVGKGKRGDYPAGEEQPYRRGNRDVAIVIPSQKIADVFKAQHQKDWEYSYSTRPPAYGMDVVTRGLEELVSNTNVADLLAKAAAAKTK